MLLRGRRDMQVMFRRDHCSRSSNDWEWFGDESSSCVEGAIAAPMMKVGLGQVSTGGSVLYTYLVKGIVGAW